MTRFVALLRGVNVGGITMRSADLADVVRCLGYDDVRTVLASGNLLFTTDESVTVSKRRLEAALGARFGYDAWVHVLTVDAIATIVAGYPFPRSDDRHAYVVFATTPEVRAELLATELDADLEQVAEGDGAIYWAVPKGSTLDSAFGRAQARPRHKPWLTTRNLNTLEKVARAAGR